MASFIPYIRPYKTLKVISNDLHLNDFPLDHVLKQINCSCHQLSTRKQIFHGILCAIHKTIDIYGLSKIPKLFCVTFFLTEESTNSSDEKKIDPKISRGKILLCFFQVALPQVLALSCFTQCSRQIRVFNTLFLK